MPDLGLRVPPPVVALAVGLLMWAAARAWPGIGLAVPARGLIAAAIALGGFMVVAAGIVEFRRARTTVNPLKPDRASTLVVTGIYRLTRNPMYLGFAMMLLGWSVYLAHPLALIGVGGFVAYMNRFQIIPEERALHSLFGDELADYARQVRRWL